ncbi:MULTISPECIES: redoxin domain-containing protein [unclassified Leptolyngbya]|uniref:redoxin domain-containing protein n=1 Tax=unclassified Leptolyngbya TaxID=2650499 RepID=UPI001683E108|nr:MULTISPECIES: redoxin domain-containing protein [unclassified Leptolyngbya]MBD1913748.1 redoxin domain-containing protein [Leptolyngbya sp. FACHB-8]MBD2153216.1 redoxin domain-containing protein [Leptolyngbya sp. FACHB-16]
MASSDLRVGCYAPDFELPGIDGAVHHLRQYLMRFQGVGVVFLSYDCALVLPALQHLMAIQQEFLPSGFTLIGIDANTEPQPLSDRLDAMATFARQQNLSFPYVRDETQEVAEAFGATHSPEVFLIDQSGMISYSGSVWGHTGETEQPFLREAIAALLQGHAPAIHYTPSYGCPLQWRAR